MLPCGCLCPPGCACHRPCWRKVNPSPAAGRRSARRDHLDLADHLHLNGERPAGAADQQFCLDTLLEVDRMSAAPSRGVLHRPRSMPLRPFSAKGSAFAPSPHIPMQAGRLVVAGLRASRLGQRVNIASPAFSNSRLVVLLSRLALIVSGAGVLAAAFLPVSSAPSLGSDWLSHGAAFLVLAALSAAALPRTSLLRLWWGLTLLGILIEVIQGLPGVNRGPSVLEALWDSAVVAAVFLVISIGAVRRQAGGPHSGSDHR